MAHLGASERVVSLKRRIVSQCSEAGPGRIRARVLDLTTAAYLPLLLREFTRSGGVIGLVLGAEGVFALLLSPIIGPWSDSFHTPLGRRRPFMLAALGPMGFCLLLMPFMPNLWTTTLVVLGVLLRLLRVRDAVPRPLSGPAPRSCRARAGASSISCEESRLRWRSPAGSYLFKLWNASPFLIAAAVVVAACGATSLLVSEDGGHGRVFEASVRTTGIAGGSCARSGEIRRFLLANSAWEATFATASTLVRRPVSRRRTAPAEDVHGAGDGRRCERYVVAALVSGRLSDRFRLARVIYFASFLYGGGLLAAGLAEEVARLVLLRSSSPVSVAGGTVVTRLPGASSKLTPAQHRGSVAGLATTTKASGLLIGAPLAGARDRPHPVLPLDVPTGTPDPPGLSALCRSSPRFRSSAA